MEKSLYPHMSILIVDDEKIILDSYKRVLDYSGVNNLVLCDDSRNVIYILKDRNIQLILLD